MKCLFIGGCKDGFWIDVQEGLLLYRCPKPIPVLATFDIDDSLPILETIELETYTPVRLSIKEKLTTTVYVPQGAVEGYAMTMLLSGYRKEN